MVIPLLLKVVFVVYRIRLYIVLRFLAYLASCELSECMTALGVPTDATEVLIRALPALTDSPLSPSSRRSSFENSEVESLKHENATLKQRLEQELESHQEAVRALGSRCEVLAEQLSTLQAQQRDINMQEQQLFGMRRQVENLQDTSNYQATRILFQQKAIGNLSQRNEELLGRIAYLEERCSISDKRRLSIEHACQEGQKKLMQYDDILTIPAEDVEIKDLELGHGSFGGTVVNGVQLMICCRLSVYVDIHVYCCCCLTIIVCFQPIFFCLSDST